jgi:hypothetical protein
VKNARLLSLLACAVFPLAATEATADNLPREHDRGFFLRLSAGAGGASTEIEEEGTELKFSGTSGDYNFALGGVVSPNLAIHGTLSGWTVTDPEVEINGDEFDTDDVTLSFAMFGAGITYYVHPANIYLSGSVGAGILTLEVDGDEESTEAGLGLDLTLGKEWWVGNRWGLGVAAGVNIHSVPAEDIDENFSGTSFGIRFSATMN